MQKRKKPCKKKGPLLALIRKKQGYETSATQHQFRLYSPLVNLSTPVKKCVDKQDLKL
jgi:hypothetical protein